MPQSRVPIPDGFEDFEHNPFEDVLSRLGQGGQSPQQPPQGEGGSPPMPQGGQPMGGSPMMQGGMNTKMPKNQLNEGEDTGGSPYLLSALQALQRFITGSSDPQTIAIARNISMLITRLIERDQQGQTERLPQDAQTLSAMQGQPSQEQY